ncbi:D-amino-acid dehydrogenase [Fontimonas thermophila]|uniref:D-amino-acid dehydrogenase n=1 Tax=Fontimonas thermophila TaxID=1076937 RepID=A0A1I2I630_9GAMM|nr:D-amino acid dehydrogenase [Fontimonas thermophila]SFF37098.1 D-amino-acid dehydrogenase [Fontimonas thermophila]
MRVLVLGAGVIGVTTAFYLSRRGHLVTVVDRRADVAAETSYANGGQISVSHAEPWANPQTLRRLLRWLTRSESPLRFHPGMDIWRWLWGVQFLRECTPARTAANIRHLVALGLYSRAALQALRAETGIDYAQRTRGILHIYTSAREFERAQAPARLMSELGCERRLLSADEAVALEPALRAARPLLAGATYTPADESGDAHAFTQALARLCRASGVEFRMHHHITALRAQAGRIDHVEAIDAHGAYTALRADAYVLALGSDSALLARPLGLHLAIQPAKGYSITMPVKNADAAWHLALTDDEHKLVFSRLGERLRIAGMADLCGYDRRLDPQRCAALLRRVATLFPEAGEHTQAQYWCGLRPATPSNLPYIGRSRYRNLYLNTGHGTLGWTHACGSARALADIIDGRKPEPDFPFDRV